jgi:2-phospho-L-lactate/phosphoenolpyruvate guanylyltransferase
MRTLEHAMGAFARERIHVVTSDAGVAAISRSYAIATMPDWGRGLNAALDDARTVLLEMWPTDAALLVLPIDLPFATADTITEAITCAGDVVIASDQAGTGTNLLLLRAPAWRRFPFHYGPASYSAHLAAARSGGFSVSELHDDRLAFDVDNESDYLRWRASKEGLKFLTDIGRIPSTSS